MAYKFQLGSGSLGGSMRVGPIEGTGSVTSEGLISGSGKLNIQGNAAVGGALNVTGAGDFDGALSCDTSFTLDAVTVNATELGFIDGITAGTALASKAVVLDASKDITGIAAISGTLIDGTTLAGTSLNLQFGGGTDMGALSGVTTLSCSAGAQVVGNSIFGGTLSVTGAAVFDSTLSCDTSFTLDAVTVNATELGFIDGVTAGTAAASKAVVLSANRDIATVRKITADGLYSSSAGAQVVGNSIFGGTLSVTGAATFAAAVTAGTSFIIGSADLNETDMEKLDGITNGQVLASKCLVVDASENIGTTGAPLGAITMDGLLSSSAKAMIRGNSAFAGTLDVTGALESLAAITAGTSFIIGTADLNEADMEKLDGITNGTVAASKAVVVSADKDISAFRRLTAVAVTASSTLTVQGSQTTASANVSGSLGLPLISDGGGLGAAGEIVAVSLSNYASAIAGTGITATNGVLSVDTSGGDSVSVTLLAVSGTAVAGMNYMGTISSSVEVALPASPTVGDVFYIKAGAGVDPTATPIADITINRAGSQLIDGEAAVVIESPFGAVGLVYAVSDVWRII